MVVHQFNDNLALTSNGLIFFYRHRGGIAGYRFRLDDAPATGLRLPSRIDQLTDSLTFKGRILDSILKARRLRVSAITASGHENFEDIDLVGLSEARGIMLRDCTARRPTMPLPEPRPDVIGGSNEYPLTEDFREFYAIPPNERRYWQPHGSPTVEELRKAQ